MARLLVVTDLDATLLDAAYRWEAARPALDALRAAGGVLSLASSKTLAEMMPLAREIGADGPLVAENGGVLAVPTGARWAALAADAPEHDGWRVAVRGLPRARILEEAHGLRASRGAKFRGFADWTDAQVARATGLTEADAALARDRLATEPVRWEGTLNGWDAFARGLAEGGVRTLRGGKFVHLMGAHDKADGLREIAAALRETGAPWRVVALGDSPNDAAMLDAADVAVVVPHAGGPRVAVRRGDTIVASAPGPAGWNEAVLGVLRGLEFSRRDTPR